MRTIVYVDGENLLHRIEDVLLGRKVISHKTDITHFDLASLVVNVIPEANNPEIRYYGTKLRSAGIADPVMKTKAEHMINSQRRLKRNLDNQSVEFIASGNLRIRGGVACRNCGHQEDIFQEKGVDVRIAVDMIREAGPKTKQVLLSSDSDLLPAIQAVKELRGLVTYVSYEAAVNRALVAATDLARTYTAVQVFAGFMKGVDK